MQLRYYSDELREKLLKIGTASLTMVEAPAGYGKTTAVRLAMETVPEDEVFWYTATESMADGSMDWFIHQTPGRRCAPSAWSTEATPERQPG